MPKVVVDGKHLIRQRNRWFVKVRVPADVQGIIGKVVLSETTGATDLVEAHRVAIPIIAGFKAQIAEARASVAATSDAARQSVLDRARHIYRRAGQDPDAQPWDHVHDMLVAAGLLHPDPHRSADPQEAQVIAIVEGSATPFLSHLDGWKATSSYTGRHLAQATRDIEEFAAAREGLTVEAVTGRLAQAWVEGLVTRAVDPLTGKTVQRKLSALRSYWDYLQAHEVAAQDLLPFHRLRVPDRRQDRGAPDTRRQPFAPADVMRLHAAAVAAKDTALADLILLAAYTGARIEELCRLTVDHVDGAVLRIPGTKTAAAARQVPVHSAIQDLVARLVKRAQGADRWLIYSTADNRHGERSAPLSKRFGRLRTTLGFGPAHVFHSLRKTVATLLEDAGCPEGVAADILGHNKPTMTYGLYSGGSSIETRRTWLEKAISYPVAP